jgi:hypothetical protein
MSKTTEFIGNSYACKAANKIIAALYEVEENFGFAFEVNAPAYATINDGELYIFPFESQSDSPVNIKFLNESEIFISFSRSEDSEGESPGGIRFSSLEIENLEQDGLEKILDFIFSMMPETFKKDE